MPSPWRVSAFAYAPFVSPDGRWIGFFENTDLKKVPIGGGPVTTLCRVDGFRLARVGRRQYHHIRDQQSDYRPVARVGRRR